MENRIIRIPIDLTKTGGVITPTEGKVVYTSDTASLLFDITGITDYTDVSASIALVMADGSVFQHEKPITASPATLLLKENEMQHAGMVTGQIKLTDINGTITSQEFIFSIKAYVLDAFETLQVIREIEIDSFETLKEQAKEIQTAIVANWDTVQANLDTMETTYAADWSAWFTTNKNSITAEWVALKTEINTKKAILAQDIAAAEANELARVNAESGRLAKDELRNTAEAGRVEGETNRVVAESSRIGAEHARAANENERKASENMRVSYEAARSTAESGRVSGENARVAGESARIAQENERVAAETARVSTASTDHNTAISDHIIAGIDHNTIETLFHNSSVILSVDEYTEFVMKNKILPTIRYIVTDDTLEEFLGAPLT